MPVFSYTARNTANSLIRGTIDGDSPRQAREQLRQQGLRIIEIRRKSSENRAGERFKFFQRKNRFVTHVSSFTGELATLISVGVPLLESLETLALQYKGSFHDIILHLKDEVASGKQLAEAMESQPAAFDRLCVKMVQVGEHAGNLDEVLRQLSEFKRRSLDMKDRVLSSLLYPLIILTASLGVSVFLMTVVVPTLLQNLLEAGKSLPLPTQILKFASDLLVAHGLWVALFIVACLVGWIQALRTEWGKQLWYASILKVPLLGTMSRKQEISRVSLIVATLLKSGIEFLEAVEIACGTSKNPLLRNSLTLCAERVRSGREIGTAMAESDFFPPLVVQIFTLGQKSGQLDQMLLQLASDYDDQVELVAGRLSTALEPVLILGMAVFVGFILFATMLPILEAGNVL